MREVNEVGDRIKELMKDEGLKQVYIAKAIGATRGTVSKWLSGDNTPAGKYLQRLARLLNTTPEYILEGVNVIADDAMLRVDDINEDKRELLIRELNLDDGIRYDIDYLEEMYLDKFSGDDDGIIERLISSNLEKGDSDSVNSKLYIDVYDIINSNEDNTDYLDKTAVTACLNRSDVIESGANEDGVICVINNDMAVVPVINYHSKCFVDKSRTEIKDGKTYLLKVGSMMLIRQVYRSIKGGLVLKAHNKDYDDVEVGYDDVEVVGWLFSYINAEKW